jgi:uncharacterized metal-binding protein YceD (DUF177 family)
VTVAPELSRPFAVERLGEGGVEERIVATAAERAAVVRRLDLVALDSLAALLVLRLAAGGTLLEITGRIEARVTQSCVVTLEPVSADLALPVEIIYALTRAAPGQTEETLDPDAPEPLPPGGLDLGEEVVQMLALGLDPYPRAPGAALPPSAGAAVDHPFAKLKALKPRE